MNYDITFCVNKTCPLRANCKRNTDRIWYPWQVSMARFKPDEKGNCEYYIPMKKEKQNDL